MALILQRALFARLLGIAVALPLLGVAASGVASAQASPAPSTAASTAPNLPSSTTSGPTAAPSTNDKAGSKSAGHAGMSYLPTIDIIPQSSFATGGDYTPGMPTPQGTVRTGGKISQPLLSNLSASYQHGYIVEAVGTHGANTQSIFVDDPIDDFRLNYSASKSLAAALGYFYRHRTCCPSATNDAGGVSVHETYLELSYAFPAIAALGGTQFGITGRATHTVAHKPATPFNSLTGGDEGNRVWPTGGASVSIPVDPKAGFTVFGNYTFAKDYFNFTPIAFWYNIIDYGFTKNVNPYLSFNLDTTNLTQHKQGFPFEGSNTIHRTKVVLTADIHIALKH